jgi:two-component system sensor histidine kinase YesM
MEMILKECNSQIKWAAFDNDVQLFMHTGEEDASIYYSIDNLYKLINMHLLTKEYFDSIYFFAERSQKVFTISGRADMDTFADNGWYPSYGKNTDKSKLWYDIRTKATGGSGENRKILSMCKRVYYGPNSKGAIIFNLDMEKVGKIINNKAGTQEENIIIIDDNGSIVYHNNKAIIGMNIGEVMPNPDIYEAEGTEAYIANDKNSNEIITAIRSSESGWRYISSVPMAVYDGRVKGLRNFMLIVVIFSLLFTFAISFIVSINTYNPIRQILSFIEQPQLFAASEHDISKNDVNEIRYIVNSFARTIDQNRIIGEELEKRVELLKKAQAVALQSQINPHFFNNTLETINWMAMRLLGGKNPVSKMLSSLSALLRVSLENTDRLILFEAERAHVSTYIDIQRIRYDNKFDVKWEIPEEVNSCKVIKITLQPLVENAIYHGIKPLNTEGSIHISAYICEERLHIIVRDNGVGMGAQECEQLNRAMRDEYIRENEHLGLMNVNQRLKLFFGESCGIHVESSPDGGTSVEMIAPVIRE